MVTLGVSISITDWESDSLFDYKKMQLWVVMATTDDATTMAYSMSPSEHVLSLSLSVINEKVSKLIPI